MRKTVKSFVVILMVSVMALQLFGCGSKNNTQTSNQETGGMGNPMVEYDSADAFKEQLGIEIDAEKLYLDEPKYFIIGGELAEIQDTKEGVGDELKIHIRAQKTTEDISGIYDDNMEVMDFDYDGLQMTHRISESGNAEIYDWYVGDVHYCVSVIGEASQMEMAQIMDLAVVACK